MVRTKAERCIFLFLLAVVAVRIAMVGDFSAKTDAEMAEPLLIARPHKLHGQAKSHGTASTHAHAAAHGASSPPPAEAAHADPVSAGAAVDDAASSEDEDRPDPQQEAMLAREQAALKVQAEQAAHASEVAGEAAGARPAGGRRGRVGAKVAVGSPPGGAQGAPDTVAATPGRKVGKKEEGASWDVLNSLRMVADGTRLVTHKRQFIVFNETLNHTVLRHWLEYVDGNETLIYHFPRSLFELLPLEEPQWHFKTCAVVGNSGVVLLRENGAEIDAHDAVLRINMAPVRGFEHYVGKKTTFNIVNSHNVRELLQGLRHWNSAPDSEARLVMFETASHFARYHLCQPLLKKFPQANPILLNPIFSNRAHRVWVQLKYLLEQEQNTQFNRKPMSGFFSVFFALNVCDKVDLYGFDAYTSKKRSYRYHYFDNVQGFTDVHSFDLALEVYKLFAQRGMVNVIT